jgi:hypothetical protein
MWSSFDSVDEGFYIPKHIIPMKNPAVALRNNITQDELLVWQTLALEWMYYKQVIQRKWQNEYFSYNSTLIG